jgi:hypothetical protein
LLKSEELFLRKSNCKKIALKEGRFNRYRFQSVNFCPDQEQKNVPTKKQTKLLLEQNI